MSVKKILMVDDDVEFLNANKALIEAHGYEVITAGDSATGIKLALNEYPHLVILDVMMESDTEGFEMSRKLADIPELEMLPVILLTGIRKVMNVPKKIEPDKQWLPVRLILDKPITPELLLAEISRILN
jgi:two-component system alkaline phosphatase synthesis response regulator PhoP